MNESMLETLLTEKKTIVVVGPGGVGKTTTSAALAVHAARLGLKVLVLTVDPARRLASSLGLKELGNREIEIDPAHFEEAGVPLAPGPSGRPGQLFGMMLDVKSTFDDLIRRHAPTAATRDKILGNPFYVQASSALAGSQEYMAMEKLYELREKRAYDLIVLDTPPTANALDFLDAPDRLEDFMGSQTAKMLVQGAKAAGRFGLGLLKLNTIIVRGLNRFVGADMLLNLLDFIQSLHELYAGFKERAGRVRAILRGPDVSFLVVTSTDPAAIDEAGFLSAQLERNRMPFDGMIVNRVRESRVPDAALDGLAHRIRAEAPPLGDQEALRRIAEAAEAAARAWNVVVARDAEALATLSRAAGGRKAIVPVPLFSKDIHDIGALSRYGELVARATTFG
jgi:anion-transporting  ArsA/GET3 family ATPase